MQYSLIAVGWMVVGRKRNVGNETAISQCLHSLVGDKSWMNLDVCIIDEINC